MRARLVFLIKRVCGELRVAWGHPASADTQARQVGGKRRHLMEILLAIIFQFARHQLSRADHAWSKGMLQEVELCDFQIELAPKTRTFQLVFLQDSELSKKNQLLPVQKNERTPSQIPRKGPGARALAKFHLFMTKFLYDAFCRAVRNNAARPENNTTLSSHTEYWCRRSKAMRRGLPAGVASIEPI